MRALGSKLLGSRAERIGGKGGFRRRKKAAKRGFSKARGERRRWAEVEKSGGGRGGEPEGKERDHRKGEKGNFFFVGYLLVVSEASNLAMEAEIRKEERVAVERNSEC